MVLQFRIDGTTVDATSTDLSLSMDKRDRAQDSKRDRTKEEVSAKLESEDSGLAGHVTTEVTFN